MNVYITPHVPIGRTVLHGGVKRVEFTETTIILIDAPVASDVRANMELQWSDVKSISIDKDPGDWF